MSITYTISTDFAAKDSLPDGDPDKVVRGSEHTVEYTAIQSAFTLAAPKSNPTFTGTATFTDIAVTGNVDGRDVAADGTKLDGIEAGATADQTGAEIKVAYEAEANTNAFTDALKSKLEGIESGAVASVSWAEVTDKPSTFAPSSHNHAASEVTSGTFADARISQSSVTQHESAIDAGSVDGYDIVVDSGSPSGTDPNTIYLVI